MRTYLQIVSRFHGLVLSLVGVVLMTVLAVPASAQTASKIEMNLPSQPLESALRELISKEGIQVLYAREDVKGLMTPEVKGRFTAEEVIQKLIEGTGLAYSSNGKNVFAIKPRSNDKSGRAANPTLLAQVPTPSDPATAAATSVGTQERIVVTSQMRSQSAYDVPMTIRAMGSRELEARGITNYQDLAFASPGLQLFQPMPGVQIFSLRGLGTNGGTSPLVGIYLDDVAVSGLLGRSLDLMTVDLDRVEVLYGPQGTLYGQGSVGGTVRFITKQPQFGKASFSGSLDSTYTKGGSPSEQLVAVANVPLVEDAFALRIAGTYRRTGGWIDAPSAGKKDINDGDLTNLRVSGLWKLSNTVSVSGLVIAHRNDAGAQSAGDTPEGILAFPPFAPAADLYVENNYDLYGLTARLDLGQVRLESTTSYVSNALNRSLWNKFGAVSRLFEEFGKDKAFSQEMRLSSLQNDRLSWNLGTFYRAAKFTTDTYGTTGTGVVPTQVNALLAKSVDDGKSWSFYGNGTYQLTDRVEVGLGARYFKEDKEAPLASGGLQTGNFSSFDPRVVATYTFSPSAKVYASAAKGFRSGGFNQINTNFPPQFDPEKAYSYEVGAKFLLPGSRLHGEVAAYQTDYKEMQLATIAPGIGLGYTGNVGKSKINGFDWALSLGLTESIAVGTTGTLIMAEVTGIAPSSALIVGDRLHYIPKYSYTLFAQNRFYWTDEVPGSIRVDYAQKGPEVFTLRTANLTDISDTINILNARLTASWRNLSLEVYGTNLLNDRDRVSPSILQFWSRPRPRSLGIRLSATF